MELRVVSIELPEQCNVILGQAHFIKTVEDLYEIMVGHSAQVEFGIGFCEASGPCLVRSSGNHSELQTQAAETARTIGAGHSFILFLRAAYPIHFLNAIKQCQEVCLIYCATANPVQVIIAETDQGRGILGVIDGSSPQGIETADDVSSRHSILRDFGYKL